jgi:cytidine deaminase
MTENKYEFSYAVYNDITELNQQDAWLLNEARDVSQNAYAPYSNFYVGAVAKLINGEIVAGTNQENASFPVGICAERVLLASASTLYPKVAIDTMAISYRNNGSESNSPLSPCGMCRQALQEYSTITNHPIRLILGGMEGKIFVIEKASMLLPFAFSGEDLR